MGGRTQRRRQGRKPRDLKGSKTPANRSSRGDVREAAAWVVEQTLATSSPAETFLDGVRERCHPRDHALLLELVRGTLTWLGRIDHVLEQASNRELSKIETALLGPLRVAVYQLLFLDRIPAHAAVNEAVEHARRVTHRGGASFTNGVLRGISRARSLEHWPVEADTESERLAIEHSHPRFLVERWLERFGREQTVSLLEANNRRKAVHLLAFRSKGGRELLAERLIEEDLEVVASELAPLGLRVLSESAVHRILRSEPFRRGHCYLQDEASQVAALVPPPRVAERILDVAAAPGGKLYSSKAFVADTRHVATDLSLPRLLTLRSNHRRLGMEGPMVVADAARSAVRDVFDRVVVDAPCSGTGTFRKNPELKWRLSPVEIDRLADAGRGLLAGASRSVRPGGLLTWITCSLEREENEAVAESFLEADVGSDFELVDLTPLLPPCLAPFVCGPGSWRLPTADDHDGFSVTVLRRR